MKYLDVYGVVHAFGCGFIRLDNPCNSCVFRNHKKNDNEKEETINKDNQKEE